MPAAPQFAPDAVPAWRRDPGGGRMVAVRIPTCGPFRPLRRLVVSAETIARARSAARRPRVYRQMPELRVRERLHRHRARRRAALALPRGRLFPSRCDRGIAEGRPHAAKSRRATPAIPRQVAREARMMRGETTRDVARRHIAEIARYCLGPENNKYSSKTELRFGNKGSISVEIGEGDNQGSWWDHEHQCGGGPYELMYKHGGCCRGDERKWLIHNIGLELPPTIRERIVGTYRYDDETGVLLFEVVRLRDPK